MINLVISGICGRMGIRIGVLASADKDFKISGGLEFSGNSAVGKDIGAVLGIDKQEGRVGSDLSEFAADCDVLIEFATAEAAMEHLRTAVKEKIGVVIGTTAFSPEQIEDIKKASKDIPIVFSPNMSVGANLLFKITEEAARSLGKDYEIEIVEAHHSKKKDAPSGTGKRLGEAVFKGRGEMPVIHSIRAGDIVGDHTVIFAGNGERIELVHRAQSRDAFANGSLTAAKFIAEKTAGLYSMQDVIATNM
jgi:4-hydroxy-tetrahydrodipicolinate reductase